MSDEREPSHDSFDDASEDRASRPESRALDEIVRESKTDLLPRNVDFARIEAAVMAQVAEERSLLVSDLAVPSWRRRAMLAGAVTLALAAGFALVLRRDGDGTAGDAMIARTTELAAGSLRSTEGTGEVRVAGASASTGQVLRAGDVVEVDDARAVVERPRKVVWLLERAAGLGSPPEPHGDAKSVARVRVKSAGEPLVLSLEEGAVEAQVTPVPVGEAFAVDVATSSSLVRVAVHGTHLRVARTGTRVAIDLTEGVVSVGVPPRTGSTYGTLVTAPAHVEFDANDLDGTLRIDHATSAVRAAVVLTNEPAPIAVAKEPLATAPSTPNPTPAGDVLDVGPSSTTAVAAPSPKTSAVAIVDRPTPSAAPSAQLAPPAVAAVAPRDGIATAVRRCAADVGRRGDVRVTISTSLRLRIRSTGDVESAKFDPPLLPEIQTCAASVIYKTKFDEAGPVVIPIVLNY